MATIYVAHSSLMDYREELYEPITSSHLHNKYFFVFPHDESGEQYNSKNLFGTKSCDAVIAESSYPSTGMGIELGWAYQHKIPILCIHKKGIKPSSALKVITENIKEYSSPEEMIQIIDKFLSKLK